MLLKKVKKYKNCRQNTTKEDFTKGLPNTIPLLRSIDHSKTFHFITQNCLNSVSTVGTLPAINTFAFAVQYREQRITIHSPK